LWRFLSSSEEEVLLLLALALFLRVSLFLFLRRLFFGVGLRDLLLDREDSESDGLSELLLELSELELGGDLLLLDCLVWRLFWEEESLSSFRIDLVFEDLDPDLLGDLPSDLDRAPEDFETGVLLGDDGSLESPSSFSREGLRLLESLDEGLGLGSPFPFFPSFSLLPLSLPRSRNFAIGDLSGESWGGF